MSHYTVLAAVDLPRDISSELKEIPEQTMQDFVAARLRMAKHCSEQRLAEEVERLSYNETQMCLEFLAEYYIDELMAPYYENTEELAYLEFCDKTEEGQKEYETEGIDCFQMPDGRILPTYDQRVHWLYEIHNGQVYKREYGHLHHRKRTKKAKKIKPLCNYPFKKLFPTFGSFMEEYKNCTFNEQANAYGYYYNPHPYWDWYQLGGRWPLRFLVKDECTTAVAGEYSYLFDEPPKTAGPDGYRWVAGARKCDIAWDEMKKLWCKREAKSFSEYEEWFRTKVIPKEKYDYRFTEEGITCWNDPVFHKGDNLEEHLRRCGLSEEFRYPISTFAFVSENGWQGYVKWVGSA